MVIQIFMKMNLSNQKMKRLTFYDGIDTAPYSPDGDFITFESDRSGSQKIYIMNLKTKKIKRISFGKRKIRHQFGRHVET